MRYFEASSIIAAGSEAVGSGLSDGPGWATWDSGVENPDGSVRPGYAALKQGLTGQ